MANDNIQSVADTTVSLGGVTTTKDLAGYTATTGNTYVPIAGLTNIGEYGDEGELITSNWISDGRTHKAKGTFNAGGLEMTCDRVFDDPGQEAMIAAAKTRKRYNLRIQIPEDDATAETDYVSVLVMSQRKSFGGPNNVQQITFNCQIDSEVLTVEA